MTLKTRLLRLEERTGAANPWYRVRLEGFLRAEYIERGWDPDQALFFGYQQASKEQRDAYDEWWRASLAKDGYREARPGDDDLIENWHREQDVLRAQVPKL